MVKGLIADIEGNLNVYRSGTFSLLDQHSDSYFESDIEINDDRLAKIKCTSDSHNEVECCMNMFLALPALSSYLARDERLWVYLTHTYLLDYIRVRWPIPDDDVKAVKHIKTHFFCVGARGIERDNAASRLWWMAALCDRSSTLTLEEALTCFLYQTDVRANIIERPTTSQSVTLFSAVLTRLNESYKADKSLFKRETFRSIMKSLNLKGGVRLLRALPESDVFKILDECIAEAS